jgi:hypothetical protein
MAIQDFKNIENINLNLDRTAQLLESKDLNIFKTSAKNVTDFGMSKNDVIEFRLYDIGNNLLEQTGGKTVNYIHKDNLTKYLKSSIDTTTQEKIFEIDIEKLVKEAGYGNGEFITAFNFLKNYVGTENSKQKVWIHEVSPSRTEIRIQPLLTTDEIANTKVKTRYKAFMNDAAELRENVEQIKNQIDAIELKISDLIDSYFVSVHGDKWLAVVKSDFKFLADSQYKAFKQKVFTDFKTSLFAQLNGKEYRLGNPNYNKISQTPFDLDEFLTPNEIGNILSGRLTESINYNMVNITFRDYPQSIKDIVQQKKDMQVLQNLLDTSLSTRSNLTQLNRFGNLNTNVKIIPNAPITEIINDPVIIKADPIVEPPIKVTPTPDVIVVPRQPAVGGGGGRGGFIDTRNSRVDGNFVQEVYK